MTIGMTTSADIPAKPQEIRNRQLLERALPILPFDRFGQKRTQPVKSGEQPMFTRYNSLPEGVRLVEGVDPAPFKLSKTTILGQFKQWGALVQVSEYVDATTQDPELAEAAKLLGESSGLTIAHFQRDVLAAGSNVYRAGGLVRDSITAEVSKGDLDRLILCLKNNKAKMFTRIPNPSTGVGTIPIADAYFAVTSNEVIRDIKNNVTEANGWVPVHKYPNPKVAVKNEVGAYENLRFIATTESKNWESASTSTAGRKQGLNDRNMIHSITVFGQDAYAMTPLEGHGLVNVVKDKKSAGSNLELYATSGYKCTTDCLILNDDWMIRYECAVAA